MASFFLTESPRWLASQGRQRESLASLARLRGTHTEDPSVLAEHEGIEMDVQTISELKSYSMQTMAVDIFVTPTLRSRFLLTIAMQTVA